MYDQPLDAKVREKRQGKVTYRHVTLASNVCFGHGLDKLARDSKVAEFHISFGVDQYVGWLDVYSGNRTMMSINIGHPGHSSPLTPTPPCLWRNLTSVNDG